MSRELCFIVAGVAATKGSGYAVPNKNPGMKPIWKPANPRTKDWQHTIAQCAALELLRPENRDCQFIEGSVYFEIVFHLPRPKALLTKSKAALSVPHTKKPDLDKLIRAAKDALSKIVWTDDAQVVHVVGRKKYCAAGEFPRAVIRIREAVEVPC